MTKSLYCLNAPNITFGVKPYDDKYWNTYGRMIRPIGLKKELGWSERRELHALIRKADIWENFPAKGLSLVAAEIKGGDEDQWIDMLYIRDDSAVIPCEVKIGGYQFDAHGQLIRYIADLSFQKVCLDWIKHHHAQFLNTIDDNGARQLHSTKFNEFLSSHSIEDRFIRVLPRTGIIMDEAFKPQDLKTIRYLNGYCGFAIRLIQIEAFVADDWTNEVEDFMFRIDFSDVQ